MLRRVVVPGVVSLLVACGAGAGSGDSEPEEQETGSGQDDGDTGQDEDDAEGDGDEGSGTKFDVNGMPDMGCEGDGAVEFSHIWIANAPNTVSKIDTEQAVELARYETGPVGDAMPSRTSVSLYGDAAVANRVVGGVTKIAARHEDCVDTNNDNAITTSTGPNDVLPWGQDECVLWHVPLPIDGAPISGPGPRLVAWEAATLEGECGDEPDPDARLWVGWLDDKADTVHIRRVKGESGDTDAEIEVPGWDDGWTSVYGGAVDQDGNLWGVRKKHAGLLKVDADTLDYVLYDHPQNPSGFYGIAVDEDGRVWLTSMDTGMLWRFDPDTEIFEMLEDTAHTYLHGIAFDSSGNAWIAGREPCALKHYDAHADMWIDEDVDISECGLVVGIGIDHGDKVWAVDYARHKAYRYDPQTQLTVTVEGLNAPYSYSDMTGSGLRLVAGPAG